MSFKQKLRKHGWILWFIPLIVIIWIGAAHRNNVTNPTQTATVSEKANPKKADPLITAGPVVCRKDQWSDEFYTSGVIYDLPTDVDILVWPSGEKEPTMADKDKIVRLLSQVSKEEKEKPFVMRWRSIRIKVPFDYVMTLRPKV